MTETNTKPLTKIQLTKELAEETGLTTQQVSAVINELPQVIERQLKTGSAGVFSLPGLLKIKVVRKPATQDRPGTNPFTGEPTIFKAKPARNVVKITPLKALKEMV